MRVLHVYRTYLPDPPGGIQEVIRNLNLSTTSLGVESRVFTLSPIPYPTEVNVAGSKVIRARSWIAPASCDMGDQTAFTRFVEQARWADLVHYHYPWPFLDLLRMAMPRGKANLLTYHSDIVRQRFLGSLYAPLMRHTLRASQAIAVGSPNYMASSKILRDVPPEKIHMIPFGLVERPAVTSQDDVIFKRLNIAKGCYFLALGVLRYYKGLHNLVSAAKSVDAPIVIAGAGPEEQNLREQICDLGVTNVIFAGQVSEDEKTVLLRDCLAFTFPSHLRSEAFGLVLIEAAMMGRPMISCEIGTGTSFVNLDSETGFVIPPDNPTKLAEAMNRFLISPELTAKLGAGARQRYESEFSAQKMGARYTQLYGRLIKVAATQE